MVIIMIMIMMIMMMRGGVSGLEKVWQWSNDYDNPNNWEEGRVPCPGQEVVIPQEIVMMPASGSIGHIHLVKG